MAKKYYAQKDALGFPIPGTMMSGPVVPKAKNIIEISLDSNITHFDKPHPKGLKYFVSVDKKGDILPNSLVAAYSAPNRVELGVGGLGVNCIQFVANTASGGTNFVMYVEVSSNVTYTVNWGDGTKTTGSINGDNNIEHDFPNQDTLYTVTLCFSDASAVTLLDFWGND